MADEELKPEALESGERPLLAEIQRRAQHETEEISVSEKPLVYLSPEDEVRRFPLLTGPRLKLLSAGAVLLLLLSVVVFLAWRKQQRESRVATSPAATSLTPSPEPTSQPTPGPSPAEPDDEAILAAAKAAVANYNPTGYGKYTLEVRDHIVTIGGEAETQPEKDGVENVVRPLPGVRAVVNNLIVRLTPVMVPVRLNEAEAKRLDEAMRKQYESAGRPNETRDSKERGGEAEREGQRVEAEREHDRRRREAAASRIREEEERARREAEERLQREAAEYERKLEEQRRLEAGRRARAEQARLEANVLRSGTIAWSGVVDGQVEVIIAGASASVRNLNGEAPREVKSSFSAPAPRAPIQVKLLSSNGRGTINIAQEPSAANGYTTIIRLDDSAKGGAQRYEFTLKWMAQ